MLDEYCERLAPGLLDEPFNALSNLAFFLAAWGLWRHARRQRGGGRDVWLLIGLMVCIGTGSSLYHTFATPWARWLDVLPILVFQLCFLWLYGRRVVGLERVGAAALVGAFLLSGGLMYLEPTLLNRSILYLPALAFLVGLGIWHRRHCRTPWLMLAGAGLLLLALVFRTLDLAVCAYLATGTHFLWHLLAGTVLYTVSLAWLLNRKGAQA